MGVTFGDFPGGNLQDGMSPWEFPVNPNCSRSFETLTLLLTAAVSFVEISYCHFIKLGDLAVF